MDWSRARRVFLVSGFAAAVFLWFSGHAKSQIPPPTSQAGLYTVINGNIADNDANLITPAVLRATLQAMNASYVDVLSLGTGVYASLQLPLYATTPASGALVTGAVLSNGAFATDIRVKGAVCDATATGAGPSGDNTALLQAAINLGGHIVVPAGLGCYSATGLVIPAGTELSGVTFAVTQPVTGSFITCPPSISGACVQVYAPASGSTSQGGNSIHDLTITSTSGAIGSSSVGLQFQTTFGVSPYNLNVNGFATTYDFVGTGTYGLEAHANNLWACNASTNYLRNNGWAELIFVSGRLGCNTDRGVTSTNYVTFTGNGPGPNTVKFIGTQFNNGSQLSCLFNFASISASVFNEFSLINVHNENAKYLFCTDASVSTLSNVAVNGSTFLDNEGNGSVFNLNSATSLQNWSWDGGIVSGFTATGGGFNLASISQPIYGFSMHDVQMNAATTVAGVSGSNVDINATWVNGLTITGAFNTASHIGGTLRGGSYSNTSTGTLSVDIPYASARACPANFGLAFGGGTTGLTYTSRSCYWQLQGSVVTVNFAITLSAVGSSTGAATFINLPLNASNTALGGGGYLTYFSSVNSWAGAPMLQMTAGTTTANFYTLGSSGVGTVSNSTFSNSTTIEGVLSYMISP